MLVIQVTTSGNELETVPKHGNVFWSIDEIIDEYPDNDNYGITRIMLALNQRGIKNNSRSTVIRAMRKGNLLHKSKRMPNGLTKADKKANRPENIIKGFFSYKT